LRQIASTRSDRAEVAAGVDEAVDLVGIRHLMSQQAGLLPTGQKRLVELARVLAGGFDVLLLDEPSSGLDASETSRFADIVLQVVEERGTSVLLVEHDMSLVRRVCHDVYVLDFGSLIFSGSAEEMTRSPLVRAAYLGESLIDDGGDVPTPAAESVVER
jgi:ABC-type branched-subunit amino acid transport system ATPase component